MYWLDSQFRRKEWSKVLISLEEIVAERAWLRRLGVRGVVVCGLVNPIANGHKRGVVSQILFLTFITSLWEKVDFRTSVSTGPNNLIKPTTTVSKWSTGSKPSWETCKKKEKRKKYPNSYHLILKYQNVTFIRNKY